jgi:hypothetical protein
MARLSEILLQRWYGRTKNYESLQLIQLLETRFETGAFLLHALTTGANLTRLLCSKIILTHAYPLPDAQCNLENTIEYWHSVSCSKISCFWGRKHTDAMINTCAVWSCPFSTCSYVWNFVNLLYAGFQPFMNPYSPLEGQNNSTIHIHNSFRMSQYTVCFYQKAHSVNAVKGNKGSALWEA